MRFFLLALLLLSRSLIAAPTAPTVPAAAQASSHFDATAATNAWLATVPLNFRSKSDSYFEGRCWLILWDFLCSAAAMLILLESGASAWMRNIAQRLTAYLFLQSWVYWIEFCTAVVCLLFPLTVYEEFFRERSYGLMNQSFGGWLRDEFVAFLIIALLLGGLAIVTLIEIVRRLPGTWPIWCTVAALAFIIFTSAIEPVFLAPLFNTYTPLKNSMLKQQVLSLAGANGLSAGDVYEVNASTQSNRVSAFVSGFGATERVTLNDNLLNRVSPQGILAVVGHEIGHYVMHHILNQIIYSVMVLTAMFLILRFVLQRGIQMLGPRWQVQDVSDLAAIPFAALILLVMGFVFTPVDNSFTRMQEFEADLYGLNAARQPDGEAEVDLLLGEYRKLDPTPLEEILFFDHPGGRTRIYTAMRWKAENLCLFDPKLPCVQPSLTGTRPLQ